MPNTNNHLYKPLFVFGSLKMYKITKDKLSQSESKSTNMNKKQLQQKVWDLHEAGYSIREIARELGSNKSSIGRMVKELQETAPGTESGTRHQPVPGTGSSILGTDVPETTRDTQWMKNNNRSGIKVSELQEDEPLEEKDEEFKAYLAFFNREIDYLLGDLNVITDRRYIVPLGLLTRYHHRLQRLLSQGAQICWELGFHHTEYKNWQWLSILGYYLETHIAKASDVCKPEDLINFRLEHMDQEHIKKFDSTKFFEI